MGKVRFWCLECKSFRVSYEDYATFDQHKRFYHEGLPNFPPNDLVSPGHMRVIGKADSFS